MLGGNRLRKALIEKTVTFGAWVQIPHAAPAEIFGKIGYDWVCVDLEHGAIDLERMAEIFRGAEACGAVPVARIPAGDPIWIRRTLDAGARGLIIPMVNSAQRAESVLREAKYPPRGERGYGYSRANLYGLAFEQYIRDANDEIAIVMQIEHHRGIAAVDDILQIAGVDAAFIGPLDLSGSYGKTGDLECDEMVNALTVFRESCARHSKAAGLHIVHPNADNISSAIGDGYTMIALGLDNVFLAAAALQALEIGRSAVLRETNNRNQTS